MSMSKFATQADYWKFRAEKAEDLLRRIAAANVIFPSMCDNNMEAWNITQALQEFAASRSQGESK